MKKFLSASALIAFAMEHTRISENQRLSCLAAL